MILFRLDGLTGKFCDISGGQLQFDYDGDNAGWMPIESMNFGFQDADDRLDKKRQSHSKQQKGQNSQRSGSSGSASSTSDATPKPDDDFQGISVGRFVDMASTQLMMLAMEDRKEDHPTAASRKADFHFLHSVMGEDKKDPRYIFPYLMITLDNVLIKGWNISASGDERPQESVNLWYDKAAMRYYRTIDGKVWIGGQVSGWNQQTNKPWNEFEISNIYFKEPKKT